jgi:photosystem I P700 chlorophyll a apoprotein A1
MLILGLSCISCAAHQIHISLPANPLLDSGTGNPLLVIPLSDLCVNADLIEIILPGFRIGPLVNFALYLPLSYDLFNSSTTSVFLGQVRFHHFTLGVVFIIVSLIGYSIHNSISLDLLQHFQKAWHPQFSCNLATYASCCIAFAHHMYAIPMYPFCSSSYVTVLCLFYHHMWNGTFLIIGGGAHASIREIREAYLPICINSLFTAHRDVIIGHLIWVSIYLGFHSFSLYIHNDTFQALRRPEDIFHDNSIQLKPVFTARLNLQPYIFVLDKKLICITLELATADYIVHSIHAFTIHVALLILSKGILYARNSRLVSDKLELGFRYPCDGPGRGGTCQISPWDHLYLAVFWMYNSLNTIIFHSFWKMQSDVWGIYNTQEHSVAHISSCDFSVNSTLMNGWLRNFLWSQAAQGIQSYATSISGYSFIFISAHFIWAFSLMFLYSGRGYWQELIESILWAHHKLKIMPHIQPRALSISQGRAVGFIHYILGGILSTWAFFISRMVVLT